MKIRSTSFVLAVMLIPAAAQASRHRPDAFLGYFHASGSKFDGVQFSGSWPVKECADVSFIVTFGRYWGTESGDGADHIVAPYLLGARYTFHEVAHKQWLPFVQVLGGFVDNIRKIDPILKEVQSQRTFVFGGGVQPPLRKRRSGTGSENDEPSWRLRIQADVFHRQEKLLGGVQTGGLGWAVSIGLVHQFGPYLECPGHSSRHGKACAPLPPPPPRPPMRATPVSGP